MKYKLLALGFKAQFNLGQTLTASLNAQLKYTTNGLTNEAKGIATQFYPDDFKVPPPTKDDGNGDYALSLDEGSNAEAAAPPQATEPEMRDPEEDGKSGDGDGE